jgi:carbon storage regulator
MLILTRKPGESLYIIDGQKVVKVVVVEIKGNQIRLGIEAPAEQKIYREEIYLQILDENKKAAQGVLTDTSLEQLSGGWKGHSKDIVAGSAKAGSKRVSLGAQGSASRVVGSGSAPGSNQEVSGTSSPKVGSVKES